MKFGWVCCSVISRTVCGILTVTIRARKLVGISFSWTFSYSLQLRCPLTIFYWYAKVRKFIVTHLHYKCFGLSIMLDVCTYCIYFYERYALDFPRIYWGELMYGFTCHIILYRQHCNSVLTFSINVQETHKIRSYSTSRKGVYFC